MPSSSRIRWVIACAAGLLLAGCDDGRSAGAAGASGTAAKAPKPRLNPVPAEMVAAVSSPKNARVVGVHFQLKGTPAAGKALPVDIVVVPHEAMSLLGVRFQARDGLAVATGDVIEPRADPSLEKAITHQLVLLPKAEGVFVVTAIVETQDSDGADGSTVSRLFSIPVVVGPAAGLDATAAPATAPEAVPPPPSATPPSSG